MNPHHARAGLLVLLMFTAPFAGCMGENNNEGMLDEGALSVSPEVIPGGEWTTIMLSASKDMSVFIPYFIQDPGSMRAQNGTVFDLMKGESVSVNVLFPPRNSDIVLLIGDYGRVEWPIRAAGESWMDWDADRTSGSAVMASPNEDVGGLWSWLVPSDVRGGDVTVKKLETVREQREDLTDADGVGASGGWVNGRDVYESGLISSLMIPLVRPVAQMVPSVTLIDGLGMQTLRMNTQ